MRWRRPKAFSDSHGVYLSNEASFGENDLVEAELMSLEIGATKKLLIRKFVYETLIIKLKIKQLLQRISW